VALTRNEVKSRRRDFEDVRLFVESPSFEHSGRLSSRGSFRLLQPRGVASSTERLELIKRGVIEALNALDALPADDRVEQIRRRAVRIGRAYLQWKATRPTRLERAALLNELVGVHADVSTLSRQAKS
jgi:hypothetical protein